jgi:hypothetical protein
MKDALRLLDEHQIENNWKEFLSRIRSHFPDRAEALMAFYLDHEERICMLPASGTDYYHNAMPGGYVDHVLRVMDFSLLIYENWVQTGMDVSNFTVEELLFAAAQHDLGKVGFPGEGNEGYLPNPSKWHRENQGKIYEHNKNMQFMLVPHRTLFMLQHYGVRVSMPEYLGIMLHDGLYDERNHAYFINRVLESKLRCNLPYILHEADFRASKWEFERWNQASGRLRTSMTFDAGTPPAMPMNGRAEVKTDSPATISMALFDQMFGGT